MFPGFKGGQGLGMFQESRESLTSMEAPTLQHKLLMLSCLPPPCSAQVSQGREEVFLAAGQPGFGKARAVSTPCFYIFMPIQNVPFWAGLSQRLHLWSVSSWIMGKETLLKRVNFFWAELQQLKWPNVVCRGGVKGEQLWEGAGACWAMSLGKGDEKATQASWLSSFLCSCLPSLSSYWQSQFLCCWMNGKAPIGIDSGPKFWALWGHPEPTAKFSRAL